MQRQLEKVWPSWMEPNEEGRVRSWGAWVRSRSVFGWPGSGESPWRERMDAEACAEYWGDDEKNGCQALATSGR